MAETFVRQRRYSQVVVEEFACFSSQTLRILQLRLGRIGVFPLFISTLIRLYIRVELASHCARRSFSFIQERWAAQLERPNLSQIASSFVFSTPAQERSCTKESRHYNAMQHVRTTPFLVHQPSKPHKDPLTKLPGCGEGVCNGEVRAVYLCGSGTMTSYMTLPFIRGIRQRLSGSGSGSVKVWLRVLGTSESMYIGVGSPPHVTRVPLATLDDVLAITEAL
ncbi:hypothetical protein BU25DRAFT_240665 [Macroventuria anomochaeta]|uniref:Uncharacterized protein n=1 Tax=Macroventuria anomochaeta TaxID=301207 RepID=A0ACB6RGZ4_9PLEO|nr:uncharacterized protein BU25DRAFT_240665 [Macroventuria anomochaeta]KAF2621216.1 hypothetical protein BU25DRAFT_240665 [Macroventuria anomochaeta]